MWCIGLSASASAQTREPASKEELDELKAVVNDIQESAAEYRNYVDALRKIKLSGYLQTQWRWTELTPEKTKGGPGFNVGQFSGGRFPDASKNLFQVRRGRLKVVYDNVLTQAVLQIDAIQTGLSLKDAYISVTEPWLQSVGLQLGVFDRPFGYEISFSSGWRETPERSRVFQTLFPGERELGAKLFFAPQLGNLTWLRADLGIFNGSGPSANEYDSDKDIIGRVGGMFPIESANAEIDFGVSGYFGKVRNNSKQLWSTATLANGTKGFAVDSTATNLTGGVTRRYLGADMQLYYDLPSVGGLTLRAEIISGKQPGTGGSSGANISTVSPSATIGPVYKRDFLGYYINLVQNIGGDHQIIAKYDSYDPNTNVSADDFVSTGSLGASTLSPADIKYSTLGLGYIYHWDGNIKFVLYYEMVNNEKLNPAKVTAASALFPYTDDVRDNVFTFRVQYRFPN
jgi:hypothetical protein